MQEIYEFVEREFKAIIPNQYVLTSTGETLLDNDQKLELWNKYMDILERIQKSIAPTNRDPKFNPEKIETGQSYSYDESWNRRYPINNWVSLSYGITRQQTETTITFTAEPKLNIDDELYLKHNMDLYQPLRADPVIVLPKLTVVFEMAWLRTKAIEMVMNCCSEIKLP